jgi:hypothetical protein
MSIESRSVRYRKILRAKNSEVDKLLKGTSLDSSRARKHRHATAVTIRNSVNRVIRDIFREDNLN